TILLPREKNKQASPDQIGLVALTSVAGKGHYRELVFTLLPLQALDKRHTVFGQLDSPSIHRLFAISAIKTRPNSDRPLNPPIIRDTKVVDDPFQGPDPVQVPSIDWVPPVLERRPPVPQPETGNSAGPEEGPETKPDMTTLTAKQAKNRRRKEAKKAKAATAAALANPNQTVAADPAVEARPAATQDESKKAKRKAKGAGKASASQPAGPASPNQTAAADPAVEARPAATQDESKKAKRKAKGAGKASASQPAGPASPNQTAAADPAVEARPAATQGGRKKAKGRGKTSASQPAGPANPNQAATANPAVEVRFTATQSGSKKAKGSGKASASQSTGPTNPNQTVAADPAVEVRSAATQGGSKKAKGGGKTSTSESTRPASTTVPAKDDVGIRIVGSSAAIARRSASPKTHKADSSPPMARNTTEPVDAPKPIYDAYWSISRVQDMLSRGRLHRGVIRINRKDPNTGYVTCDDLDRDVLLFPRWRLNRAFDGDVVYIKLINGEKILRHQKTQRDRIQDRVRARTASRAKHMELGHVPAMTEASAGHSGEAAANNAPETGSDQEIRQCGQVVLVDAGETVRTVSGTVRTEPPLDNPAARTRALGDPCAVLKAILFRPQDPRLPRTRLVPQRLSRAVLEAIVQGDAQTVYEATVDAWPVDLEYPLLTITRALGPRGTIEVETAALLADNCVRSADFSPAVIRDLPSLPWSIPAAELATRWDLRRQRIFTIDPATARDLDDAVSCWPLANGNLRVGVHIADVSYFVDPETALDREARQRATTVYLVQRAVPMLPHVLSQTLCSLNPGVDRLAYSVMWEMTPEAEVVDVWFGRTVIHSCCRLAYEQAQHVVEGNPLDPAIAVHDGHAAADVAADITRLFGLSRLLRERRFRNGALTVNSIRLHFDLDAHGQPVRCYPYDLKDSNRLIEEFMLLANMSVAHRIAEAFPDQALLRCHPAPLDRLLTRFHEVLTKLGYHDFDTSSSGAFHRSFQAIEEPRARMLLQLQAIKPMCRAKYFCTGYAEPAQYAHYALSVPLYTHFTSPIRRYADVIVHRLLTAALAQQRAFYLPREVVRGIAGQCNRKKELARQAQDQSIFLYLVLYLQRTIRAQGGRPLVAEALVLELNKNHAELIVPAYGVEKRVHWDRLPLHSAIYYDEGNVARLVWRQSAAGTAGEENAIAMIAEGSESETQDAAGTTVGVTLEADDASQIGDAATTDALAEELDRLRLHALTATTDESSTVGPQQSVNTAGADGPSQELHVFQPVRVYLTPDTKSSPAVINVTLVPPEGAQCPLAKSGQTKKKRQ
ncbi:hypothetical protein IWQ60_011477, partial [Tieghemiomyces parasiticus]